MHVYISVSISGFGAGGPMSLVYFFLDQRSYIYYIQFTSVSWISGGAASDWLTAVLKLSQRKASH